MTSKINAITTGAGGIEVTGDSSGQIEFQADGTTVATLTTSGLDVSSGLTFGSPIDIASGGTGQTTATSAFNALAPSQSTHSGKFLTTDGTNTSWGSVSTDPTMGGDLSGTASNAQIVAGAVGATELASTLDLSGKTVTLPSGTGGKVLQVVQKTFTGTQSVSTPSHGYFTNITNLSQSITPSSTSSKILILLNVIVMHPNDRIIHVKMSGGNSASFIGNSASNRARSASWVSAQVYSSQAMSLMYLDSPNTTSSITYTPQMGANYTGTTWTINYNVINDSDLAYITRGASSMILMEIAG